MVRCGLVAVWRSVSRCGRWWLAGAAECGGFGAFGRLGRMWPCGSWRGACSRWGLGVLLGAGVWAAECGCEGWRGFGGLALFGLRGYWRHLVCFVRVVAALGSRGRPYWGLGGFGAQFVGIQRVDIRHYGPRYGRVLLWVHGGWAHRVTWRIGAVARCGLGGFGIRHTWRIGAQCGWGALGGLIVVLPFGAMAGCGLDVGGFGRWVRIGLRG